MDDFSNDEPMEEDVPREEREESFADLLDAYSSGMSDNLQVGDKVEGTIISIGRDTVFVDTGTKVDATVEKEELLDENGELPFKEGDTLTLFVVAMDEHEIRLSKALSGVGGLQMLREAHANSLPVEGKVNAVIKGGFDVRILQRRAFCPVSQMDVQYVETPEDYVGQTHEFIITRFEERGRNIVVSRRRLLEEKLSESRKEFYAGLEVGQQLEGTVIKLMPFGAFVELAPGVEGMAHISELSWSRVEKPEDAVAVNQKVLVKVIGMESGGSADKKKIALSIKQVQGDPWNTVDEHFSAGQRVEGKVTRLAPFGAFVEIAPGIDGLVHISEMSYVRRVVKVEDVISAGETVQVVIKEIDLAKRRISLSIRDAEGDPWDRAEELFSPGEKVEGTLVKKESFGIFIELVPGITGLLPKSALSSGSGPDIEKAKPGETVGVTVSRIDKENRKISLAPADTGEIENWQEFSEPSGGAMSDLAAKLQEALRKK